MYTFDNPSVFGLKSFQICLVVSTLSMFLLQPALGSKKKKEVNINAKKRVRQERELKGAD